MSPIRSAATTAFLQRASEPCLPPALPIHAAAKQSGAPDAVDCGQGENHQDRGGGFNRRNLSHPAAGLQREEVLKMPWLVPEFANERGRLRMTIHSPDRGGRPISRIVVDTGLGNDKGGPPRSRLEQAKHTVPAQMTDAGYPPDTIDLVLCTHLHVDHVGWNTRLVDGRWVPTFTNARYLFGKTEYEHWAAHQHDPAHPPVSFIDSVKPRCRGRTCGPDRQRPSRVRGADADSDARSQPRPSQHFGAIGWRADAACR